MHCPNCRAQLAAWAIVCPACRTPIAANRTATAVAPSSAGRAAMPLWPLKRWQLALIAGIAALVLLAGIAVAVLLVRAPWSPEDTVRAYYEALADRDADRAKALLAPGYDGNSENNTSLLNSRTLGDPGYVPPRNLRLDRVDPDSPNSMTIARPPDVAVLATYEADGKPYRQELRLIPHDGGKLDHKWRIANPLLPLEVRSEAATPLVAGTPLEANGRVVAFPGAYTVALPSQALVRAEPMMLLAGPTDVAPLKLTLLEGAHASIQQAVHRYVDACRARTEFELDGCPFDPIPPHLHAPLVSRRIVEYPALRIEVGPWGEVSVTSSSPGQVEFTPHTSATTPRSFTTPFTVNGRARLTGDTFTFARF